MCSVLLVEDDPLSALCARLYLERNGCRVVHVENGEAALIVCGRGLCFDVVLMDVDLGNGMNGVEAASLLISLFSLPVVFFTSYPREHVADRMPHGVEWWHVGKNSSFEKVLCTMLAVCS